LYSYRIENAIEKSILMIPDPRRQRLLYQKIVQAVVMHQRAIESVFYIFITFYIIITLSIDLISVVSYFSYEFLSINILISNHFHYIYLMNFVVYFTAYR